MTDDDGSPARPEIVVDAAGVRTRPTARVIVLDEHGRALMFFTKGSVPAQRTRWITPGGGVDPGETAHDAAVRELFEETGMVADDLGSAVAVLDTAVDYPGGDHDRVHAEYFLLRTSAFTPSSENWTESEHIDVLAHRWWSAAGLATTQDEYEPAELVELIGRFTA